MTGLEPGADLFYEASLSRLRIWISSFVPFHHQRNIGREEFYLFDFVSSPVGLSMLPTLFPAPRISLPHRLVKAGVECGWRLPQWTLQFNGG